MKKNKKRELAIPTKSKKQEEEVLEWEVVLWKDVKRWTNTLKFNDAVQITSWFYKGKTWKVIGRQKVFVGEKMMFSYNVLLETIDLVEVFEKELKVLFE